MLFRNHYVAYAFVTCVQILTSSAQQGMIFYVLVDIRRKKILFFGHLIKQIKLQLQWKIEGRRSLGMPETMSMDGEYTHGGYDLATWRQRTRPIDGNSMHPNQHWMELNKAELYWNGQLVWTPALGL